MKRSPTHPGEMLQDEFLTPLGLTQAEAARRMRMSTKRLNELVRGKRGVTSPEIWLNLQMAFELWHAVQAQRRRGAA